MLSSGIVIPQGWRGESSHRGAGAFDTGAKIPRKCSFHTSFCQTSSDKNPKCPSTGGLDASNDGAVAPLFSPGATRVIFLSGFLVHHNQFEICGYTRTRETSDKYVGITISPTSFRHTTVQIVPEKYKCKACRCTEIFPVSP